VCPWLGAFAETGQRCGKGRDRTPGGAQRPQAVAVGALTADATATGGFRADRCRRQLPERGAAGGAGELGSR
jgi:hypothetical protein